MSEFEALELSATLTEKHLLTATVQIKSEKSIMTVVYSSKTQPKWQVVIGKASLFIDVR